ncbi:hypothetical protein [Pendulispora albinea]|uniref:Aminoglycoside phosphotransferase domain-containing protein n=1 Tax=Pendulispora albinea TaxID=2741071 RepID=A0ABZ2LJR5_9BACT
MSLPRIDEIGIQPAHVAWDLADDPGDNAALLGEVHATEERRTLLAFLRKEVPVAKTCKAFLRAPYCRPTIHRRTIYLQLEDGGVFAIKGTEPHAGDLREEVRYLEAMRAPFYASMLNDFALSEHKVPMAMTLDEAMAEAHTTLAFQRRYVQWFGRVARMPLHVLVYRWGADVQERLLDAVLPSLCATAQRGTRRLVSEGLGALVYYYPSLPLRASQQAADKIAPLSQIGGLGLPFGTGIHDRAGASFASRFEALQERSDPWNVVQSWIALLADMLMIGYFPLHTYFMGHCLQAQNLCIDGGVADTDSLHPMAGLPDDTFYELFAQSVGELTKGSVVYITGTYIGRYTDQLIGVTIWQLLHEQLRTRIRERAPEDPRLARLMSAPPLELLDRVLRATLTGHVPSNAPIIG